SFDIAALAMAVNTKASRNETYMFYKGSGSDTGIYLAHSPDSNLANGSAWGATPLNPGINTSDAPAAVSFNGSLYFLYKGSGGDSRIYVAQPPSGDILDGAAWSANPLNPGINTSTAPAVAAFNGTLYMLYKGVPGDSNVYIARPTANNVGDGAGWSANRLNPGINTSAAPAVATLNSNLYMLYKGSGGDTNVYIASSNAPATGGDIFDGSTWSATRLNPGINTSVAPGVVVFNGVLYMFYKGSGNDTNIYIARSTGGNILDGSTWSATRLNLGINTVSAPRPVVVGNSLYLFYMGSGGDTKIWVAQPSGSDPFNGDAWQTQPLNPGINTSTAPGAAVM
ncbi:MAG TPA: sialidase family protein, partial [Thermoanaerobaculia bacterium]|nr:sialidase family protein [Thermoanaerobaculia bacterium]